MDREAPQISRASRRVRVSFLLVLLIFCMILIVAVVYLWRSREEEKDRSARILSIQREMALQERRDSAATGSSYLDSSRWKPSGAHGTGTGNDSEPAADSPDTVSDSTGEFDPAARDELLRRATDLFSRGDYDGAVSCTRLLIIKGADDEQTALLHRKSLFNKGLQSLHEGVYGKAVRCLDELLTLGPEDTEATRARELGFELMSEGQQEGLLIRLNSIPYRR